MGVNLYRRLTPTTYFMKKVIYSLFSLVILFSFYLFAQPAGRSVQRSAPLVYGGVTTGTNFANGVGSYSTASTNAIGTTGYTNNTGANQTAYVSATAVSFTIKNRAGTAVYVSPTLTATVAVNLQPGWAVTAASGLLGTAVPF